MTKSAAPIKLRIVGGKVMMPADLRRLHTYMLDIERIDHISDEMRAVVESEWPELAHKLPPKRPQGQGECALSGQCGHGPVDRADFGAVRRAR